MGTNDGWSGGARGEPGGAAQVCRAGTASVHGVSHRGARGRGSRWRNAVVGFSITRRRGCWSITRRRGCWSITRRRGCWPGLDI